MTDGRHFENIRGCTVDVQFDHKDGKPCMSFDVSRAADDFDLTLNVEFPSAPEIGGINSDQWFAKRMAALTPEKVETVLDKAGVFSLISKIDGDDDGRW